MRLSLQPGRLADRVVYLIAIMLSFLGAFLLRFDGLIPSDELEHVGKGLLTVLAIKIVVFHFSGLHQSWRQYTGPGDLLHMVSANFIASVCVVPAIFFFVGREFPRSIYVIDFVLCVCLTAAFSLASQVHLPTWYKTSPKGRKRILIYGAGEAGTMLLRELLANRSLGYQVDGFLDDDPTVKGCVIMGVPVLGVGRDAPHIVERLKRRGIEIREIILVFTSATGKQMREALANCRAAGVQCRTIPGIGELLEDRVLSSQIRNVAVNDLLGREPVVLDEEKVRAHIIGRSVLVTGAGGSIGSELCRQVARFEPRKLIAFDQSESDLFRIDAQLRAMFPALTVVPELGDIRDFDRICEVLRRHQIDSIYHAAAYKHVPLLENHVTEAVRNNILGTWNVLQAARECGVTDLLMISSDKAVNPTSLMGASKRVCEMIVCAEPPSSRHWATKTVAVRFGNVLGSNGSVVPTFQAQIAAGGPVTVTHPDMQRYFMTVTEAVMLVLQAATMSQGREIFVLDMGAPVKIVDLAKNMIHLAGLREDEDIEIHFTGLRPGEKLFEELNLEDEHMLPTFHPKIKIFQDPLVSWDSMNRAVSDLRVLVGQRKQEELLTKITELVSQYVPESRQPRLKISAVV